MNDLAPLSRLIRHHILTCTSTAGSGHPTSSMSATDLMTALFFKHLRFDGKNPDRADNDRVIFSKGHAAPLLYALYAAAGLVSQEELQTLRKHGSPIQGHPTPQFRYADAATGSLGQGLSVGVGMALNAKYLDKLPYQTYVLMGDGEMAEGSIWEAIQIAAYYKLDNLIGFIDVNRFGQSQETMYGHDVQAYADRVSAFGWHTIVIDGHDLTQCDEAIAKALKNTGQPSMIVARTEKGKGVSFMSDKEGWHGKALSPDKLEAALKELGNVPLDLIGEIQAPAGNGNPNTVEPAPSVPPPGYKADEKIATRKAFGMALSKLTAKYPEIVSLDGDTKNSTFAEFVAKEHPDHFFEMFIAEQNMVGVAVGLSKRGKVPFLSTFAAFLTRGFDQIRMASVSNANIKCVGSHVGVSIGEDGPSQMGLEDISMFRSIHGSTILYPSDGVSAERLVEAMVMTPGIVYLRTSRPATPILYDNQEAFPIGGSKTLRSSKEDAVTLVGAGVTLHESLAAHEILAEDGVTTRVIDCYSIKPIDEKTLQQAAEQTRAIFVIEDHWSEGGIGDAVLNVFSQRPSVPIIKIAVTRMPGSGPPQELLDTAGISRAQIVRRVKSFLQEN